VCFSYEKKLIQLMTRETVTMKLLTRQEPNLLLLRRKDMEKPKLVTPEELSQILGISEFTIRKLVRTDELPCVYVKHRIFFDFDALVDYLYGKECAA
jgi:hypothetical protein